MPQMDSIDTTATLRIWLLGGFRVAVGARYVADSDWRLRKAKRLVKLLALAPRHRLHREQVLDLLWPEAEPEAATNSLHRTLYTARHVLEPSLAPSAPSSFVALHEDLVMLGPAGASAAPPVLWTDVEVFEAAAATARHSQDPAAYQAALDWYVGELLPEDRYEEWAVMRRDDLARLEIQLLEELARLQAKHGDQAGAIAALERLLAREPTREEAHVGLMRLYALSNQRYQALRQYQQLRDILHREMATTPMETTTRLYQAIQAGTFQSPAQRPPATHSSSRRPQVAPTAHTAPFEAGGSAEAVFPTPLPSTTPRSTDLSTDLSASAAPGLQASQHPAAPPTGAPTNLPAQMTSFIGRTQELTTVHQLLGATRLVTLTGAGGCGKTRLALRIASEVGAAGAEEFPDGVWLIELAALTDPALVPRVVARALGLQDEPDRQPLETLLVAMAPKRLVLLLDNCEHLIDACARLAEALLRACPHLRLLATSRERLGIGGETVWRVPSLAAPDPERLPPFELFPQSDAVRLFIERARASLPAFELTPHNAAAVARICHRLDGMPLALELAAARLKLLSVEQIAARLDDALSLLSGGSRTAARRQQTLRATLDWSYDLLGEPERVLFRRLAVFAGGWTLEAAEGICADQEIAQGAILDVLSGLVDQSLVIADHVAEQTNGEEHTPPQRTATDLASTQHEADAHDQSAGQGELVWFRLLEPVRQYAAERLRAAPEADAVHQRHVEWYLALAERAAPELAGREQVSWLARLEVEHSNLRAALQWSQERKALALSLRLGSALGRFWDLRGHLGEGLHWLEQVLDTASDEAPSSSPSARAKALYWVSALADTLGDQQRAARRAQECLALCRELGDAGGQARALNMLAVIAQEQGDYAQAATLFTEALEYAREAGDQVSVHISLNNLGNLVAELEDYAQAADLLEESLAISQAMKDEDHIALTLLNLSQIIVEQGDYARATSLADQSLVRVRALGDTRLIAGALYTLGVAALRQGELKHATAQFEEAMALKRKGAETVQVGITLRNLSICALHQGKADHAFQLGAQGAQVLRQVGDKYELAEALASLGHVAHVQGHAQEALSLYREAVTLCQALGTRRILAMTLEGLAEVVGAQGRADRAARLLGAAEALRAAVGAPLPPLDQPAHERQMTALRSTLGRKSFEEAGAQGRAFSRDQAIAEALAVSASFPGDAEDATASVTERQQRAWLSAREREVAALVAAGRTNREIAAELRLAGRTVDAHVSHILNKLGLTSRTEVAAWVRERDLVDATAR